MKTITRGPRGLGLSIFLAVLFALVADASAQEPAELIIRNGLIVTAVGRTEGDLRIRNGTIAEIGPNLTAAAGARVSYPFSSRPNSRWRPYHPGNAVGHR